MSKSDVLHSHFHNTRWTIPRIVLHWFSSIPESFRPLVDDGPLHGFIVSELLINFIVSATDFQRPMQSLITVTAQFNITLWRHQFSILPENRSRSTQGHQLSKFCSTQAPDDAYKDSRSLAFWFRRRRFFLGFYHIWPWRPSWSCDQDHLSKFLFPHNIEAPYEIWLWLAQWFLRRRCLKSVDDDGRRRRPTYPISSPYESSAGSGERKTGTLSKDWFL